MAQFPPDFAKAFLQLHNQYRETHYSPPLEIIDELSKSAQEWADQLAVQGVPEYKSDPEYGENIFAGFLRGAPENVKPEDAMELWYREGRYFKYGEETVKNPEDVRHFTQLVWKGTTSMGIGMAIGSDDETYIVCFYKPPGNVPKGYAENVVSPFQNGDAKLLPHEAAQIKTTEVSPEVAASMRRLYAVPSEKLRVWSAWLMKISELTDEWQKWLRSNIDLAIRIGEHLEAAAEALKKSKMADEDKADEDLASEGKKEAASQREFVEADLEVKASKSKAQSTATVKTAASSMVTVQSSKPSVQESRSTSAISRSEEMPIWPLGVPWQPTGKEEEEPEEEVLEKLPIPRNEEEMKDYLKKFNTDAVMYRSYYKHWRETADQTISEVGGRYVMATFLVQGRREEALERIAEKQKRVKAPKKGKRAVSERKRSSSITSGPPSVSSVYVIAPQSVAPEPPETSEPPEADKATEDPEKPEEPAEQPKASTSKQSKSASQAAEKTPSKSEAERDEALDVDEVFRDCARADEPIPYHFYLRAEPDVELAGVEDENDEILEIDLTRAEMIGSLKRLYYNIAEKPFGNGKPWF